MSESNLLAPLATALRAFVAWSDAENCRYLIIGGVAASLLGRPRITRDIDAVVLLVDSELEHFLAAAARFDFVPRIPDVVSFARASRVLLMHHEPSGIDLDISLGALPFEEEAVARALSVNVGDLMVTVPTPEDLIIMKAIAHRNRDRDDIQGLLDTHPKLDLRRVRRWVRDFAATLEMPELLRDLEKLLAKPSKKKRRKGKT